MKFMNRIKDFWNRLKINSTLKYKTFLFLLTVFVLIFGTSKWWLPSDVKITDTSIGTALNTSTNTSLTLRSWQYNRAKNYMEISFDITNNEDNQSLNFTPSAHVNTNRTLSLNVSVALCKDNSLVLQIKDVPQKWDYISLWVKDNQATDQNNSDLRGANFFCDIRRVVMNNALQPKAELSYAIQSVQNEIDDTKKQIQAVQADIQKAKTNIDQLQFDIQTLKDGQKYQTKEEIDKSNSTISSKTSEMQSLNDSIAQFNDQIKNYNVKLDKLNQKLNDTKSGKIQSSIIPASVSSLSTDSETDSSVTVD